MNITVWRYCVTSLQMDNRGNRLLVTDDSSAINTPAVSAGHVIKRYQAQAPDELTLQVRGQVFMCLHAIMAFYLHAAFCTVAALIYMYV